jgi:hypothetical protein
MTFALVYRMLLTSYYGEALGFTGRSRSSDHWVDDPYSTLCWKLVVVSQYALVSHGDD